MRRPQQAKPARTRQTSKPFGDTTNEVSGGARRDRTDDPLLAKQVLSQLSYGPIFHVTGPKSH